MTAHLETARPENATEAEEWRGLWVNFYQYRHGQRHFGDAITESRQEADAVRAVWFKQAADQEKFDNVLAYDIGCRRAYWIDGKADLIPEDSPYIVKVRNCIFSIAVPYVPPEGPQDDNIPF
ncbi:hypothetical protein WYO_5020 [Methylobacterium sp. GXF4]|uniref:hypothetical protein n=1 Tax=Methylobacterium sp. GXF4 TaxID=1096546 RepID=UPI00026986F3|nr:hypothetical protein [Methylobacterium sp. GXF4]EIZ82381.1 hypothetical protein WYO_5020 [Methylobacterium sp. GXF4]